MAKPSFKYPSSDIDNPDLVLSTLGTFWSHTYQGNDLVYEMLIAAVRANAQAQLDLVNLLASVSRFDVPVFHKENWHYLTFRRSDVNKRVPRLRDGTDLKVIEPAMFQVGVPLESKFFSIPCPESLVEVPVILNRLVRPTMTLTQGIDYYVSEGLIYFRDDLFESGLLSMREIWDDGEIVDYVAGVWLYRGSFDWNTVYEQFGYALKSKLASSEGYKELINAVFDSAVFGTSNASVEQAWSAVTDIPLTRSTGETVEYILTDSRALHIITDKVAYKFRLGSNPLVAVGDRLEAGQPLVDSLQFIEFKGGEVTPDILDGLVVGPSLLDWGYYSDIAFENRDMLLGYKVVDGQVQVLMPVQGFPGDIERFNEELREEGIRRGRTLAQMLDQRTDPDDDTPPSLPSSINPLKFLVRNFLRYNAFAVRVKANKLGPNALGLWNAWQLKRVVPPYALMLVVMELEHEDEAVIMEGPGDETQPGYEETVTSFPCMVVEDRDITGSELDGETVDPSSVVESVRVFQIRGRCE